MSGQTQDDALTLLQQLVAPCERTTDHAWRKCKRCAAVHGIDMRFPLSMRLLQAAIDRLQEMEGRPDRVEE